MISIERGLNWAVDVANDDRHGYSQVNRLGKDFDCSSFVSMILVISGFVMPVNCTTWTLEKCLIDNGWVKVIDRERQRGDILLNKDQHVVMCLDDKNIVHASGVKKGILVEPFYTPSFGYPLHYRYIMGQKTNYDIALEVIAGLWGNYPDRKTKLENAGYNYEQIQNEVESILHHYVG